MARHRRLLASLAFYALFLGGGVAAGFYLPSEPATSKSVGVGVRAPAGAVRLTWVDCSRSDPDRTVAAVCRRQRELLRDLIKP